MCTCLRFALVVALINAVENVLRFLTIIWILEFKVMQITSEVKCKFLRNEAVKRLISYFFLGRCIF